MSENGIPVSPFVIIYLSNTWLWKFGNVQVNIFYMLWHLSYDGSNMGPVSISNKTSYCKISRSLVAVGFVFRIVRSLGNLTGTSAALKIISTTKLAASRIIEILRWDVFSDIETGPMGPVLQRGIKQNGVKFTHSLYINQILKSPI